MISITEEPYDGPLAQAFVQQLLVDLNERYANLDESDDPDDDDYLAEVTPAMVQAPHGTFLVAWVNGEPAGCGALKPLDSDPSIGEIKRMYTAETARRRGISRRILARLEEIAADRGYTRIQLETGTAQPEAMALYDAQGWYRVEPYGHYRDSPWSVCYGKDLVAR